MAYEIKKIVCSEDNDVVLVVALVGLECAILYNTSNIQRNSRVPIRVDTVNHSFSFHDTGRLLY